MEKETGTGTHSALESGTLAREEMRSAYLEATAFNRAIDAVLDVAHRCSKNRRLFLEIEALRLPYWPPEIERVFARRDELAQKRYGNRVSWTLEEAVEYDQLQQELQSLPSARTATAQRDQDQIREAALLFRSHRILGE